ncbi:MAG: hypothetical protein AB7O97_21885 [Planctomycetota bacterium]
MTSPSPRLPLAAWLLATACASGGTRPGTAASAAAPDGWAEVMRRVDEQFDVVQAAVAATPQGDLEAAAAAARRAAALVREGYGRFERRDVPGFAAMARDCESWLLAIAMEADHGHGDLARDRLRSADPCARCHDAAERRPW